jgi:hypothetical protein
MKRYLWVALVPVLGFAVAFVVGCGGGGSADLPELATEAAGSSPQTNVTVVAKGLKFDTKTIVVPAKTSVTITLDNQDSGANHNVAVYRAKDAKDVIHRGELFEGREEKADMNGAFVVK